MNAVEERSFTRHQRRELEGYVSLSTQVFRIAVFLVVLSIASLVAKFLQMVVVTLAPQMGHWAFWVAPVVVVGIAIVRVAPRWTGGKVLRRAIRRDLEEGNIEARRITVVDAIEVEEGEEEGPSYFLHTDDGNTLLFWGQYLEKYKRRGFPWASFEILEAPHSRIFFGLKDQGDALEPSMRLRPLDWDEIKTWDMNKEYQVIDIDFGALKAKFARIAKAE